VFGSRYSQKERRLPYYESVFLVRADVSSQQVEALAKSFTDIIAYNGGSVAKTEHWGLRTLAYRIKKNRKAHYVLFNIDAPAAAVLEMERNMRLNEDVLRTLTLRVDELEEEPSAILAAKGRDDRGRRDRGPRSDGPAGGRPTPTPAAASAAPKDAEQPKDAKPSAPAPEKASAAPEQSDAGKATPDKGEATSEKAEAAPDKAEATSDKADAAPEKGEAADKGEDK
jgi:small subunit ribosomal protein S6